MCVFCAATENLEAAHLLPNETDLTEEEFIKWCKRCKVAGLMDLANGITLCRDCHTQFDHFFVGVDPATMSLEVSNALSRSAVEKVRSKWERLQGKRVSPRSEMGKWPSKESFRDKFIEFKKQTKERQAKNMELKYICERCTKRFSSAKGLKSHQGSKTACANFHAKDLIRSTSALRRK
jgi:hypothetical protein